MRRIPLGFGASNFFAGHWFGLSLVFDNSVAPFKSMWGVLRLGHDTPLIAVAQAIVVEFFESCRKATLKLFKCSEARKPLAA
jgi:hypothetical protein